MKTPPSPQYFKFFKVLKTNDGSSNISSFNVLKTNDSLSGIFCKVLNGDPDELAERDKQKKYFNL